VLETSRATKKGSNTLRVTVDDQRRYREIYTAIDLLCREYQPYAIGVEAYLVGQQAASSAWKTAVVYGGILFYAYSQGMFAAPFLPLDLKRRFAGKKGASKMDVADGLFPLVDGLEEKISRLPKTKREHAVDAAGHAFLVFEEVDKTRELLGI
jgi:Holliday junction resolvasome RuvABC endonuclease subunit